LFTQILAQAFLRSVDLSKNVIVALGTDEHGTVVPIEDPADRVFAFPTANGPDSPILLVHPGERSSWIDRMLLDSIQPLLGLILISPTHLNEIIDLVSSERSVAWEEVLASLKDLQTEVA